VRSIRAARSTSGRARTSRLASLATMSRLRPTPAACYIHPKGTQLVDREGDYDADLDVAGENLADYLSWVAQLYRVHLGYRVLEVGTGLGGITARYEQGREVVAPACLRPACGLCASASSTIGTSTSTSTSTSTIATRGLDLDEGFDSVLMVNVLEHIANDAAPLRRLRWLPVPHECRAIRARPQALYGARDERIGHYRRYSVRRLPEAFGRQGRSRLTSAGSTSSPFRPGPASDGGTSTILSKRQAAVALGSHAGADNALPRGPMNS